MEHWEHAQITGRLAGENMTGGTFLSNFFLFRVKNKSSKVVFNFPAALSRQILLKGQ